MLSLVFSAVAVALWLVYCLPLRAFLQAKLSKQFTVS